METIKTEEMRFRQSVVKYAVKHNNAKRSKDIILAANKHSVSQNI